MQLEITSRNPARQRGLRRARYHRAVCEPAAWTPMPAAVAPAHLLALLTRVRAARVAAGELSAARLYDVRAYKTVAAEHGYLRRLARPSTGGTVITSMPQLVKGLAHLHPAWKMDGDRFDDRDRHHSAVRRRLRDQDAMGLLVWRIGIDVMGEDARTELQLRPAPDVTADELADAKAQLARWRRRYGTALNTGSTTGIRNVDRHARPLPAAERRRRGQEHASRAAARRSAGRLPASTRDATQTRRRPTTTNTAPLSEASATPRTTPRPGDLRLSGDRSRTGDRRERTAPRAPAWLAAAAPAGAWPPRMQERSDAIERAAAPNDRAALVALRTAASSGGGLECLRRAGAAGAPADLIALAGWALVFPGLAPRLSEANRLKLRRSGRQLDRLDRRGAAAELLLDRLSELDIDAAQGDDPRTIAFYLADLKATARALRRHHRRMPPPRPHRPRGRD